MVGGGFPQRTGGAIKWPGHQAYDEARKLWAASKPTIDRAQFGGPGVDGAICRTVAATGGSSLIKRLIKLPSHH
jgi:hypothetical protein